MGHIQIEIEKLDDLRRKANDGMLTPEERKEYEALVETIDCLAISQRTHLSAVDRDAFLKLLDAPPIPNEALQQAADRYRKRLG